MPQVRGGFSILMKRHFLFILGSARHDGNTEALARRAARSLPETVEQTWIHLLDHQLPLFEDIRHDPTRKYSVNSDAERTVLEATLTATDIVIASPVYWYSVSASVKLYFDHWSGWVRLDGVDFKARMAGKTLWSISALSDEDWSGAQPLIDMMKLGAEYMDMKWGGALLGYGNRPRDILNDAPSIARADQFFLDVKSQTAT
jgi:putative NADPH-quinone reductase